MNGNDGLILDCIIGRNLTGKTKTALLTNLLSMPAALTACVNWPPFVLSGGVAATHILNALYHHNSSLHCLIIHRDKTLNLSLRSISMNRFKFRGPNGRGLFATTPPPSLQLFLSNNDGPLGSNLLQWLSETRATSSKKRFVK